ncbi:hypothetical protein WS70_08720 [Burkholderia mayonis]|uniref:Uncharacterized protein n=1 Tax=Burkholderia mayonis TaxID=1385591 RepID=A0A1B4FEB6_9BURK|nr:hypothetical protein WS70_08720 [Burkholderia mayonis]KVE46042.1 hypothetical protein WS70_03120 [Burkholderia mayonis]
MRAVIGECNPFRTHIQTACVQCLSEAIQAVVHYLIVLGCEADMCNSLMAKVKQMLRCSLSGRSVVDANSTYRLRIGQVRAEDDERKFLMGQLTEVAIVKPSWIQNHQTIDAPTIHEIKKRSRAVRFLNGLEYDLVAVRVTCCGQPCEKSRKIGVDVDVNMIAVRHEERDRFRRTTGERSSHGVRNIAELSSCREHASASFLADSHAGDTVQHE